MHSAQPSRKNAPAASAPSAPAIGVKTFGLPSRPLPARHGMLELWAILTASPWTLRHCAGPPRESVIAAVCILGDMNVDEIVARLSPAELRQVITIVGRSPNCYPPGVYAGP